jgi:hypothetical protein
MLACFDGVADAAVAAAPGAFALPAQLTTDVRELHATGSALPVTSLSGALNTFRGQKLCMMLGWS